MAEKMNRAPDLTKEQAAAIESTEDLVRESIKNGSLNAAEGGEIMKRFNAEKAEISQEARDGLLKLATHFKWFGIVRKLESAPVPATRTEQPAPAESKPAAASADRDAMMRIAQGGQSVPGFTASPAAPIAPATAVPDAGKVTPVDVTKPAPTAKPAETPAASSAAVEKAEKDIKTIDAAIIELKSMLEDGIDVEETKRVTKILADMQDAKLLGNKPLSLKGITAEQLANQLVSRLEKTRGVLEKDVAEDREKKDAAKKAAEEKRAEAEKRAAEAEAREIEKREAEKRATEAKKAAEAAAREKELADKYVALGTAVITSKTFDVRQEVVAYLNSKATSVEDRVATDDIKKEVAAGNELKNHVSDYKLVRDTNGTATYEFVLDPDGMDSFDRGEKKTVPVTPDMKPEALVQALRSSLVDAYKKQIDRRLAQ